MPRVKRVEIELCSNACRLVLQQTNDIYTYERHCPQGGNGEGVEDYLQPFLKSEEKSHSVFYKRDYLSALTRCLGNNSVV